MEAEWMAAMRRGDYAAAWTINDAVLAARHPDTRDDPRQPYHCRWVWDGRDYRGVPVLIRCYHGLGDTLQFARYLPAIGRYAASLTVEAQAELLPLLAALPGPTRLAPFVLNAPLPVSACDIEIMELAHALRLPPGDFASPYLAVAPARTPPGTIGLCWQAGGWDPGRSVPAALFAPLAAARPSVTLQPAPTALPVLNPRGTGDIAATAALIAGLDLVITVDTMVAHLAGALGRPVWLLLKHAADWRWGAEGGRSDWYPTMRLYRQNRAEDWPGVIARVLADLRAGD